MKKIITGVLLIVFLLTLLSACVMSNPRTSTGEYRHTNIRIFRDTPAWDLARAVNSQNTRRIERIAQESPELLDYIDPMYGLTLLIWSVGTERYNSAEALLRNGANPDIIGTHTGGTALFLAANFSWIDTRANRDPRFVELLLSYGADPNINFVGDGRSNVLDIGTSPLRMSIGAGIEKTRALVEGGADINHRDDRGRTAAVSALLHGGGNRLTPAREYAYFLIVEMQADVTQPYLTATTEPRDMYPIELLRNRWVVREGTEDYRIKMEILEEFERQGVNVSEHLGN